MTHKDLKSHTIDNQVGGTSQTDGRKIPHSAFGFKKFIALPQGLKVKSGDTPDSSSPRKPIPVKAVPLSSFQSDVNAEQIGVSTTFVPSHVEPNEIIGTGRVSRGRSRRSSVSSTGSTGTPNGSISSIPSEGSYTPRYRKRSSSTPPDLGRQRPSPVDKRIGKLVNQYYSSLYTANINNNAELYSNGDSWCQDEDDLGFYTINPDYEDAYLDYSDNTQVFDNWQLQSTDKSQSDDLGAPGHGSVMHPHYVTLPRGGGQLVHQRPPLKQLDTSSSRASMAYTNGTIPRGLVVYNPSPSKDVIVMGNGYGPHQNNLPQGSLYKSRGISSSMPTLLDGKTKADKKFLKELKKQEKEERKRFEKEEKRRLKEEKKRQKALKKAQARTLPRSWGYVNKPIESVYSRPKLSLSAVPIDYEDNPSLPQRSTPAPSVPPPPLPSQPSVRTRSLYSSAPDLLRLEQVYGATIRGYPQSRKYSAPHGHVSLNGDPGFYTVSSYAPRTVVLQRGPEGYGFVLRGAKSQSNATGELDFCPTAEFPALQYLDSVEPGSRSDRAGLKSGDFLLEINGENVVRASHDRVVQLIRQAGDTLAMSVVTVRPMEKTEQWVQQLQDGSKTLPTRGASKKPAPQPPQRDPHTSISLTKTQGKQIAEGMAELDQLDKILAENDKQEVLTQEQKTASIRSSHSAKRVSCVELGHLENGGIHTSEKYMSPSELRIKKYHQKKTSGSSSPLERSRSTSDLLEGKRVEPVYATPVTVPSVASKHKRTPSASGDIVQKYDYDGEDSVSLKSASSYGGSTGNLKAATGERPKAPPPPPPGGNNVPKRQAPAPPKDVSPVRPAKTEMVTISTNNKVYATTTEIKSSQVTEQSDFESSFKPGNNAKMADEPKIKTKPLEDIKTKSHQRDASSSSKKSDSSHDDASEKHSVSFAEDKVFDSAKTFLQKHPNAKLLVTADVHTQKKKMSEPEPDYDVDSDEEKKKSRNSVTVIAIGDKKTKTESSKQYTIRRSDIPASPVSKTKEDVVIPPPPKEPAPKPPAKSQTSQPPPSTKLQEPAPVTQSSPARQPSPQPQQQVKEEVKKEVKEEVEELPVFAPPPPAPPAPPPPPPPPPPTQESPASKTTEKQTGDGTTTTLLPTKDIMAAVEKRKTRLEAQGPKLTPLPEKKNMDNQAAIIAAVARRRKHLEEKSDTDVLDQIESRLQKTKKLQSAKFFFSSETVKKNETKTVEPTKATPTPVVTAVSNPVVSPKATPKVEIKPVEEKKEVVNKTASAPMKPLFDSSAVGKPKATEKAVTKQKSVEPEKPKDDKKPTTTDYLAMAEKVRQDWLKKKSSSSSIKAEDTKSQTQTKTLSTSTTTRAKSEPPSPVVKESNSVQHSGKPTSPTPVASSTQIISTKPAEKPKVNGEVRKTSTSTPLKTLKDTDLISRTTSIRDRIANFEKQQNNKPVMTNGRGRSMSPTSPRYKVQGVTTDSSATEGRKTSTSALPPPPPGFGDVVHVDIIPPPTGFQPKHEDTESVISSVSTLSTLSDDHADSGYSLSKKNSYEDLIPPPPPGFDDTDQGYDETPAVIPPPADFENNKNNNVVVKPARTNKPFLSKSVESWQCIDVLDWLDSLSMTQYKSSFQQHCIDGKRLAGLSRNDYIELGVTQVGHRMNLERSIKKAALRTNSTS